MIGITLYHVGHVTLHTATHNVLFVCDCLLSMKLNAFRILIFQMKTCSLLTNVLSIVKIKFDDSKIHICYTILNKYVLV